MGADRLPPWLTGPLPALPPWLDHWIEQWARTAPRVRIVVLLAAVLGAGLLTAAIGGSPSSVPVLVAVRDLPVGSALGPDDVRAERWPAAIAPPGAVADVDASGAVVVLPVAAGTPVTATHLQGPLVLAGIHAGEVLVTAPGDGAPHVQRGDVVDVVGTARDGSARRLASAVRVVDATEGQLWLAVPRDAALLIAEAVAWGQLAFAVHPPGS